jgi:hypothetical protein
VLVIRGNVELCFHGVLNGTAKSLEFAVCVDGSDPEATLSVNLVDVRKSIYNALCGPALEGLGSSELEITPDRHEKRNLVDEHDVGA